MLLVSVKRQFTNKQDLGPKSGASHSQSFTFHSHAYAWQHLTESTKVSAFLLVRESLIRLKA